MNGLTWKCMVCGEERPDDKISVASERQTLAGGVTMTRNVRFCNDKPDCEAKAREEAKQPLIGSGSPE